MVMVLIDLSRKGGNKEREQTCEVADTQQQDAVCTKISFSFFLLLYTMENLFCKADKGSHAPISHAIRSLSIFLSFFKECLILPL